MSRDMRDDCHGTPSRYREGCSCESCLEAWNAYRRDYYSRNREQEKGRWRRWRDDNHEKDLERRRRYRGANEERLRLVSKDWYWENREYALSANQGYRRKWQERSLSTATTSGAWSPHEDALLSRVSSTIAAASALGRTYNSVRGRRERLRKKGLLA